MGFRGKAGLSLDFKICHLLRIISKMAKNNSYFVGCYKY